MRLGSHPPREALYNNLALDNVEGRRGPPMTPVDLDHATCRLKEVVEDLGGVVRCSVCA